MNIGKTFLLPKIKANALRDAIKLSLNILMLSMFLSTNCFPLPKYSNRELGKVQSSLDFRIINTWSMTGKANIKMVFGVVNPRHVNREDALIIAKGLKVQFSNDAKLRVLLWDNEEDAHLYGKRLVDDLRNMGENLRIIYFIDRNKCQEYIEFIPDKGKPKDKVKIEFDCNSSSKQK